MSLKDIQTFAELDAGYNSLAFRRLSPEEQKKIKDRVFTKEIKPKLVYKLGLAEDDDISAQSRAARDRLDAMYPDSSESFGEGASRFARVAGNQFVRDLPFVVEAPFNLASKGVTSTINKFRGKDEQLKAPISKLGPKLANALPVTRATDEEIAEEPGAAFLGTAGSFAANPFTKLRVASQAPVALAKGAGKVKKFLRGAEEIINPTRRASSPVRTALQAGAQGAAFEGNRELQDTGEITGEREALGGAIGVGIGGGAALASPFIQKGLNAFLKSTTGRRLMFGTDESLEAAGTRKVQDVQARGQVPPEAELEVTGRIINPDEPEVLPPERRLTSDRPGRPGEEGFTEQASSGDFEAPKAGDDRFRFVRVKGEEPREPAGYLESTAQREAREFGELPTNERFRRIRLKQEPEAFVDETPKETKKSADELRKQAIKEEAKYFGAKDPDDINIGTESEGIPGLVPKERTPASFPDADTMGLVPKASKDTISTNVTDPKRLFQEGKIHELTQNQYIEMATELKGNTQKQDIAKAQKFHEKIIRQKIAKGQFVPEEVLKDYPDLVNRDTLDVKVGFGKVKGQKLIDATKDHKLGTDRIKQGKVSARKNVKNRITEMEASGKLKDSELPTSRKGGAQTKAEKIGRAIGKGLKRVKESLKGDEKFYATAPAFNDPAIARFGEIIKKGVDNTIVALQKLRRPKDFLRKVSVGGKKIYDELAKKLDIDEIRAEQYIRNVYYETMETLRQLGGLSDDEMVRISKVLDDEALNADEIIAKTVSNENTNYRSLSPQEKDKAAVIAEFFRDSAEAGGIPEQRLLKNYLPHWQAFDEDGFSTFFLPEDRAVNKPAFQYRRAADSEPQSHDVLKLMEGYARGVKRHKLRNSITDINKSIEELKARADDPKLSEFEKVQTLQEYSSLKLIQEQLLKVYRPNLLDKARTNYIQNSLKLNFTSSLQNATQPWQLLLADVGPRDFFGAIPLMKEAPVRAFLNRVGIGKDKLAKFGELDIDDLMKMNPDEINDIVIDVFGNVEEFNQVWSGVSGMLRRMNGNADELLAAIQRIEANPEVPEFRHLADELAIAAKQQNKRVNFAPEAGNRTGLETDRTAKLFLTFLNHPMREAALVADWVQEAGQAALRGDFRTSTNRLGSLGSYMMVKTLLTGRRAANLFLPRYVADRYAEIDPQGYEAISNSKVLEVMDEANLIRRITGGYLDFSDMFGFLDLSDAGTWKSPLLQSGPGNVIRLIEDFSKDDTLYSLGTDERRLPADERAKAIKAREDQRAISHVGNVIKFLPRGLAGTIKLGKYRVEPGLGFYQKLARAKSEMDTETRMEFGRLFKVTKGEALTKIVGPSEQESALYREREQIPRAKKLLRGGAGIPKDLQKDLAFAKGVKPEELEAEGVEGADARVKAFEGVVSEAQQNLFSDLEVAIIDDDVTKAEEVKNQLIEQFKLTPQQIAKRLKERFRDKKGKEATRLKKGEALKEVVNR